MCFERSSWCFRPLRARYAKDPTLKSLYDAVADVFAGRLLELMDIRQKELNGEDLSSTSFFIFFS